MRVLRKIIFINSAHIRYAEVKVDGNVHFIGTQGVGKSTLLRAILFFYNADKQHLGIPREMKPFDEFYLPHANSYIVYEVENDQGPYSIMVNRSSYGRASYRFIDAPYDRSWLIDEHGEVTADQKSIVKRLGKLSWRRIEDYSRYRDIIYGNSREAGKDMVRYQLIEARRYQNIYRSIQNVFLNSRLDADFIKDIIIRSMNDEEISINLGYYRNQVADFEQEYDDISRWYQKNAKGETPVRLKAESVISAYHGLLYLRTQIQQLCGELNYSIRTANDTIPQIDVKISVVVEKLEREKRLLSEVQDKYKAENSKLTARMGVLEDKLKQCKSKREEYAHLQIETVLERCSHENQLRAELQALGRRLDDLTAQYSDITTKYKRLAESEESRFAAYKQSQQQRTIDSERQAVTDKERLIAERDSRREEIAQMFAERIDTDRQAIESLRVEASDCRQAIAEVKHHNPYAQQIKEIEDEIHNMDLRLASISSEIKACEAERDRMQSEIEQRETAITSERDRAIADKQRQIESIGVKIAEIDRLLARVDGSLYQWLDDNVAGWQQNIGKIIDEAHVLYQTGLRPKLAHATKGQDATAANSLYGVTLDLSELPMVARVPDELKHQKAELQSQIQSLQAECEQISQDADTQLQALSKKYSPQMREARDRIGILEVERNTLPGKVKAAKVRLNALVQKTADEQQAKLQELQARQQDIAHRLEVANAKLEKTQAEKDKQRRAVDKAYTDRRAQIDSRVKALKEAIEAETAERERQKAQYLAELSRQESDELKGKGADARAVEQCKSKIAETQAELTYIENSRKLVYGYNKDKEELFDKETEYRTELKDVKDRLTRLDEKFALRRQEHLTKINKYDEETGGLRSQKQRLADGLKKASDFVNNSTLCPPMLHEAKERKTSSTPDEVVTALTSLVVSRHERVKKFQESINEFKAFFGAKNTFNFRTTFTCEDDYIDFAANLDDFVQNNKIEEYRSRVNERYIEILRRASKEMGDMTRHESEIERIINDINGDFRDKNFVGVIKLIALRLRESSDPIVQMLKRIKDFHDENREELGEVTLFTTERRDDVNRKAVDYILDLMRILNNNAHRQALALADLFQLEFRVIENDNDTGWVAKLSHVGSEGTDTLVKAMVNIMLINVFKQKVSKRTSDFIIHCMMDEIGKLHPQNIKGILEFANSRNILLINSSPTTSNVSDYRYTYLLDKDAKSYTIVHPLITQS